MRLPPVAFGQVVVQHLQRADAALARLHQEALAHVGLVVGHRLLRRAQREHAAADQFDARQQDVHQRRHRRAVAGQRLGLLRQDQRLARRLAHRRGALRQRQCGDLLVAGKADEGVEARVQPVDDADAARGGLQVQRQPGGHAGLDAGLHLLPLLAAGVALQPGHRQRPAAGACQLLDQVELGVEALRPAHQVEIADHLHHAVLQALEGGDDAGELGRVGLAGRRVLARGGAVVVAAAGGKAGRAGLQRLAHQRAHGGHVLGGGGRAGQRALAHHRHAHRVVRHLHQEVQAVRHALQRVHVLREALPVEAHAFGQRHAGDVLHAFHQVDQVGPALGLGPLRSGAKPTPQLPIISVVTPWWMLGEKVSSQLAWPS